MKQAINWWHKLEKQWQKAFGVIFFQHFNTPSVEELEQLFQLKVLRIVGPTAPYPNLNFELTSLAGIGKLVNLEILIITHHKIKSIKALQKHTKLKSLFLFNNEIESLEGIEQQEHLEQLYAQHNHLKSLRPLSHLLYLKEVNVNNNLLDALDGLTEKHSDKLKSFFCMPNGALHQKEIIRVENQLGIRCKSV